MPTTSNTLKLAGCVGVPGYSSILKYYYIYSKVDSLYNYTNKPKKYSISICNY